MAEATKEIPPYVEKYYWWAYARPWAAKLFDHQFMVNAILLGNYNRLRDIAIKEIGSDFSGRTLQVGCCYGNLTPCLAQRVAQSGGTIDVIDVLKVQLKTLQKKIRQGEPVSTFLMDAAALEMPDNTYDRVVIFLLLHEQPQAYRERTLREALRVLKPGGEAGSHRLRQSGMVASGALYLHSNLFAPQTICASGVEPRINRCSAGDVRK